MKSGINITIENVTQEQMHMLAELLPIILEKRSDITPLYFWHILQRLSDALPARIGIVEILETENDHDDWVSAIFYLRLMAAQITYLLHWCKANPDADFPAIIDQRKFLATASLGELQAFERPSAYSD